MDTDYLPSMLGRVLTVTVDGNLLFQRFQFNVHVVFRGPSITSGNLDVICN
jgi:hypothetical protein